MSSIEHHKELIQNAVEIVKEFGISTDWLLESIVPFETEIAKYGYDIGLSCRIGEPSIFGEENRTTYIVRLDNDGDFEKLWREE